MKLYKYRSIKYGQQLLLTGKLRASSFVKLNDPFDLSIDSLFHPSLGNDPEEIIDAMNSTLLEYDVIQGKEFSTKLKIIQSCLKNSSSEQIQNLRKEMLISGGLESYMEIAKTFEPLLIILKDLSKEDGIICFSKRPDINPLWAHYANNHAGIVIGFKPNVARNSLLILAKEVIYNDQRPFLAKTMKEYFRNSYSKADTEIMKEYLDKLYHSKCKSWSYEEELRVVTQTYIDPQLGYHDFSFYPDEVQDIYFGNKTLETDIHDTMAIALKINPSVKFYRMIPDKYSYDLIRQEI